MKIIKIENPTFQIFDKLQRVPTEYEFEISASVHSVNTIVAGKITEDDDGLDGWLIDEHEKGMDEIYLLAIEEAPMVYNSQTFEPEKKRIVRYYSRKKPKEVINTTL